MSANVHVFISYAHKDGSALASQLRSDLAEKGYVVWLDVARLGGGSDWSREIEIEIDAADVVLALLSTGSLESDVCRGEQLRSLRRDKCVIPVLVHDKADRPVYLGSVHETENKARLALGTGPARAVERNSVEAFRWKHQTSLKLLLLSKHPEF